MTDVADLGVIPRFEDSMPASLQLVVATTPPRAATLFLRGALSCSGATRATEALAALPPRVRDAHLDLARLRIFDVAALESVLDYVRVWARERDGFVSVTPPSASVRLASL